MFKRKMLKKVMAVMMMAALTVTTTGCGAKGDEASKTNAEKWGIEEFTYVMIPGEDTEKAVQLRDNMCQDLSEAIGIPVNVYRASDYNAAVEAMRTGNAQMALLGPFSYITAVERAGAECICVTGRNGNKGYQSYIIAKSDSDIEGLADLEGRSFGFVDPSSTSGNIVPSNDLLNELNLSLSFDELHLDGKFFSAVTYVGSHDSSLQSVIQGNVDAAAISSNTYNNQIEKGNVSEDDLKIIHASTVIPGSPICIQKDLPEELKQIVEEFLLAYDEDEYFGGSDNRYVSIEDSDYDIIRELQEKYGLTD